MKTRIYTDEERKERHRETVRKWRAKNSEKLREASRKWRAENPEKAREASRKWRAENPEKAREAVRKWQAENHEKAKEWRKNNREKINIDRTGTKICSKCGIEKPKDQYGIRGEYKSRLAATCKECEREKSHEYYINHREKYKELHRRQYEKNREAMLKKSRKWYAENSEKAREAVRKWHAENPEKAREDVCKWRAKNPEKAKEWKKNNQEKIKKYTHRFNTNAVENITDRYVKQVICETFNIKRQNIPTELVNIYREQIKFKRLIKIKKNENIEAR